MGYAYRVGSLEGATGGGITGSIIIDNPAGDSVIIDPDLIGIRGAGGDEDQVYFASNGISVIDQNGHLLINISIDEDGPGITMYESSVTARGTEATGTRKVEFREGGVLLYGTSEIDTVCHLLPDGNIIGKGQLAMGQNHTISGDWSNVLGFDNEASGYSATISGGYENVASGRASVVGGGTFNDAKGNGSVVGGGYFNDADTVGALICGGTNNSVTGVAATICGGLADTATGDYSFIGGGGYNRVEDWYSVVPGGYHNHATGWSSFAAGRHAYAEHDRTFVWNDGGGNGYVHFTSTDDQQFLINAGNGVGINTASPESELHVNGKLRLGSASPTVPIVKFWSLPMRRAAMKL